MNIHEFQAKQVLAHFGVPVPRGSSTETAEGAAILANKIIGEGGGKAVVKAQIHAGGRGKAGGVKVVDSAEKAQAAAAAMLGAVLVTPQTGPAGKKVSKLLVEEGTAIERELYLSLILDRSVAMPAIVASAAGGMDIEEVAAKTPEKIVTERVNPILGLRDYQVRRLNKTLGLTGDLAKQGRELYLNLFQCFMEMDCRQLEINPLVVTGDGKLMALDAKLDFDDTALHRHPEIAELRDLSEEEPLEVEAGKYNLNYIKLDGNVGCMVNGAGLAMATMDIIKQRGGSPANFLDVGGGANVDTVKNGFRIILSDENVKAVLINIFGGIVRCDRIANGIIEAVKELDLHVPVVVRLAGTNAEVAKELLSNSGVSIISADSFEDAASKVVKAAQD